MPSVNIYTKNESVKPLEDMLPNLREFTAKELSCGALQLTGKEMSIRIIVPTASAQIADTELEIKAYSFGERVKKQDNICESVRNYIQRECPKAGSVYVWLQLSELGHSGNI
jgi:hypothetical protein